MVVIEAIEMINEAASNALLKTLEEPGNGLLILISTRPESLLPTIRSRCQKIPFSSLTVNNLKAVLSQIALDEHLDIEIGLNQKELIQLSNGSPGALIKNIQAWQDLPEAIWMNLKNLSNSSIDALNLARKITEDLDIEQQLWIINWLQQHLWSQSLNPKPLKILHTLRSQLNA